MKRKMIIMLLVGAMTLSVAGCGAKEEVKNDVSVKVESTADNVSDSKTVDAKENDNKQIVENKADAISEPIDMTKTEIMNVINADLKTIRDVSIELPVVTGSKEKYQNGRNYLQLWVNGQEYYNLSVELGNYDNTKFSNDEVLNYYRETYPTKTYDVEEITSNDGTKAVVCFGYNTSEDPEMYLDYRYRIFDFSNGYTATLEYHVSIDKSVHDAGMNLKNSSAVTYESVLREAIKGYAK